MEVLHCLVLVSLFLVAAPPARAEGSFSSLPGLPSCTVGCQHVQLWPFLGRLDDCQFVVEIEIIDSSNLLDAMYRRRFPSRALRHYQQDMHLHQRAVSPDLDGLGSW